MTQLLEQPYKTHKIRRLIKMDRFKTTIDIAAGANMIATIVGWLPAIAALFTIVWTGIQIYSWYRNRSK